MSEKKELDVELANLNEVIEEGAKGVSFMLNGPGDLTVLKGTKYSKVSHVGGESFNLVGIYLGKRDRIIFQFRRVDAAAYDLMEMSEPEAKKNLDAFEGWMKTSAKDVMKGINEARKAESLREEFEKTSKHAETYASIGFGSW